MTPEDLKAAGWKKHRKGGWQSPYTQNRHSKLAAVRLENFEAKAREFVQSLISLNQPNQHQNK